MARPPGCPGQLYGLMLDCWDLSPDLRPPAANLAVRLATLLDTSVQHNANHH